jgi:hypothetical protein
VEWPEYLARAEARLDAIERAGQHAPADLVAPDPAPTGPIPAELVDQADALRARTETLSAELAERLDEVASRRAALRWRARPRSSPVAVDRRC